MAGTVSLPQHCPVTQLVTLRMRCSSVWCLSRVLNVHICMLYLTAGFHGSGSWDFQWDGKESAPAASSFCWIQKRQREGQRQESERCKSYSSYLIWTSVLYWVYNSNNYKNINSMSYCFSRRPLQKKDLNLLSWIRYFPPPRRTGLATFVLSRPGRYSEPTPTPTVSIHTALQSRRDYLSLTFLWVFTCLWFQNQ